MLKQFWFSCQGGIQSRKKKWKIPQYGLESRPPPPFPTIVEKYKLIFLASGMILSNLGKKIYFPFKTLFFISTLNTSCL